MLLEMEELMYYLGNKFNAKYISEGYSYLFYTKAMGEGEDGSEEWEGMVGELKNTIKK